MSVDVNSDIEHQDLMFRRSAIMKVILSFLGFLCIVFQASADVRKGGDYTAYIINESTKDASITFSVSTVYETYDHCNHFGLNGDLRAIKEADGIITIRQDFFGDFFIIGTGMACPPSNEIKRIPLSGKFTIDAIKGRVLAKVIIPKNYELKILDK